MHKSRLAGFIIDCHTTDLHEAARFCVVRAQSTGFAQRANEWK